MCIEEICFLQTKYVKEIFHKHWYRINRLYGNNQNGYLNFGNLDDIGSQFHCLVQNVRHFLLVWQRVFLLLL
jgi:hypothetical protein